MAFPIRGERATISSITASELNLLLITALRNVEISLNVTAPVFDVTALDGTGNSMAKLVGLGEGSFTFRGHFPKAAPKLGNTGLVTGPGYLQFVTGWEIQIEFGEEDITSQNATAPVYRAFMPKGRYGWRGRYTCHQVNDVARPGPDAANSFTGTSAIFKICEDAAADPELRGNILIHEVQGSVTPDGKQLLDVTFEGTGDLSEVKGTNFPRLITTGAAGAVTAITQPTWDTPTGDGVGDISVVLQLYTNNTVTGAAFLRSMRLSCQVGDPIEVSGEVRFTGTITPGVV